MKAGADAAGGTAARVPSSPPFFLLSGSGNGKPFEELE